MSSDPAEHSHAIKSNSDQLPMSMYHLNQSSSTPPPTTAFHDDDHKYNFPHHPYLIPTTGLHHTSTTCPPASFIITFSKSSSETEDFVTLRSTDQDQPAHHRNPCQVRAKRGCATHPRSIAERNRRGRISERIRKLQQLFPNIDKQTSIAEMLDEAVEYVRHLQNQLQILKDARANCTCL